MPFLAPAIAAAVGVGAVGEALIGIGLSVAMAAGARALAPKPRDQQSAGRGMRLSLRLDPNAPREVAIGTCAVAGTLDYHHVWGPNGTDYLDLVQVVSDCECDGLEALYVNGKLATWHADTGLVDEFPGMVVRFHSGSYDQTASALIMEGGGTWSTDHRGRGIAYVHVRITYSETLYQTGLPKLLFIVRGAKMYDWRLDSTQGGSGSHRWGQPDTYEYSDNPVVALYNYRRGFRINGNLVVGLSTPASAMPVDDWTAAANACDELVSLAAGGTEKRYRCSGFLSSATDHRANIVDLLTAMAGREISSGGVLRPLPGVAQAAVLSFTDDDIMVDAEVQMRGKRPRSQLVNAVFGSYHDPDQIYESVAAPPRISPTDEEADGGIQLAEHYALDMVTSQTQAQRVLEILRRRERQQAEVRLKLRARYSVLEAGDWITWTSERYGFVNKTFEVASVAVDRDWSAVLVLRETASSVYAWTPATDELDPLAPATVSPAVPTVNSVAAFDVETVTVTSSSGQRPGLRATWSPITDRTVVSLLLQYRMQGDANVFEHTVLDPSAGQATWVNSVLASAIYEVRAKPVTLPVREVTWTSWVATPDATGDQVVEVGTLVPAPESIGPDELDAQTRFELSLTTATDEVLGSAGWIDAQQYDLANRAGEEALRDVVASYDLGARVRTEEITRVTEDDALASLITTVQAGVASNAAAIVTEQTARASADSALASSVTAVTTTVGGHTTTISQHQASIDGLEAQWGIVVTTDGVIVGAIRLDTGDSESAFTVDANYFQVRRPGASGGAAVPVFTISTVDGVTKLALRGDMIADGAIYARSLNVTTLSSITANIGTVTAGRLQNAANTSYIDLNTGEFQLTAA